MEKGKLIVLEGIDGSGTSTQAKLLYEALQKRNYPVELTSEPSDGAIGNLIRDYLKGEQVFSERNLGAHSLALLFAADRLDHLGSRILPWLIRGKVVVSDRYLLSSLAYQSLDCDLEWIKIINREAPPPDLTILLDLPVEISLKRVSQRQLWPELFEKAEIQKRVRENYLRLARELYSDQRIVVIDADKSIEEIGAQILKEALNYLQFIPGKSG